MKYTEKEIELDLDKDILQMDVVIPFRTFWDYVPSFIISTIRRWFDWPGPSKRESYQVKVMLLKALAVTYKSRADSMRTLIQVLSDSTEGGTKEVPEAELN